MKKRLRSKVLAVGMVGSTLLGAGSILYYQDQAVRAQDKPAAAQLLDRGAQLYQQRQYPEAKKVLLDIDPAQLPEDQRTRLSDLVKQTDLALAKTADSNTTFDNAKTALDNNELTQAAKLYQIVAESPNATGELKENAKIQLALIREKQKEKAPAMQELLKQAIAAYDAGRLDESQNALHTIEATGSDLGWENNAKPAKYERLIAEKRVAMGQPAANPAVAVAVPTPAIPLTPFSSTPAPTTPPIPTTAVAVATPTPAPAVETPTPPPATPPVALTPTTPPPVAPPATPPATPPVVVVAPTPVPTDLTPTTPVPAPATPPIVMAPFVATPTTTPATTLAAAPEVAPPTNPNPNPNPAPAISTPGLSIVPGPAAPAPANDILTETLMSDKIPHDRALTIYDTAMSQAAAALKNRDFRTTIDKSGEARDAISFNRRFFSDTEADQLIATATRQLEQARADQARATESEKAIQLAEANKADRSAAVVRLRERHRQVNRLLGEANAAYDLQAYSQAADLIRQALVIDPTNNSAKLSLQIISDRIKYYEFRKNDISKSREFVNQMVEDQEHLVPYTQLLIYPEDWPELSRRRQGEQSNAEPEANRRVRDALDRDIAELAADQQGFEKIVKYLAESQQVNIVVNWKALEAAGVDRNAPVTVNLKNIPFRKALNTVLAEAGGAANALSYTIDEGVITISTKDELSNGRYLVVRVYDIRDMLVQPDATTQPPSFNLSDITKSGTTAGSGGGSGGGGGGGGGGLFTDTGGANGGNAAAGGKTRDDIVKDIIGTVESTVAPESWRDTGGTVGSMKELNGQLIINQTADNQIAVFNLLQQLRETRALQIAIEARLLLVSNNFLDDFGFGWGITVPSGQLGTNVTAFNVTNNTFNQVAPPSTGIPGSLASTVGPKGSGGNALDISGQILDNFQLNLLLRATQADQRTTTVTAPRVTLFNGQRGYLAVTNQQNFVSNFNQSVASGGTTGGSSTGTNLQVSTLTTGVVLYVEATVSADRRYVVMKLKPQLSSLDGIDTFTSSQATTAATTQQNANGFGTAFVQLPRITYTTVDTMVSVPDGGTLLIGGQKLVGESEIEVGVPILSKIPGINRLFTNRSYTKDERTLLILVRPKIIIQREEEYKTFGMNYDAPGAGPVTPMVPGGTGPTAAPAAAPAAAPK